MKVITTNRLNRFWKNGVLPIKNALANKLNTANVVNNLLTTAAGYALDARQGKALDDKITALNGKLKIKYADNGKAITIGANGTVYYTWSVPAVTGYTPIAVVIIGPGYPDQFTVTASLKNNNTVHVYVKNNHGAQLTSSIDTRVIYIPSDMWQAK